MSQQMCIRQDFCEEVKLSVKAKTTQKNPNRIIINQQFTSISQHYKIIEKIGQGGFGFIYKALEFKTNRLCAIKFETLKDKKSPQKTFPRLKIESTLLKLLNQEHGDTGMFPEFISFKQNGEFSYMVMECLGNNLEQLIQKQNNKKFSVKTTCMLGIQIINRIQKIHELGFLYRDIKPENIVIGLSDFELQRIVLLDFGLIKPYKNQFGKHVEAKQLKGLVGTPRYASINSHEGRLLSRRDDIESIAYTLIYFLNGSIPWMNIAIQNKEAKREKIKKLKYEFDNTKAFKYLPNELQKFLSQKICQKP